MKRALSSWHMLPCFANKGPVCASCLRQRLENTLSGDPTNTVLFSAASHTPSNSPLVTRSSDETSLVSSATYRSGNPINNNIPDSDNTSPSSSEVVPWVKLTEYVNTLIRVNPKLDIDELKNFPAPKAKSNPPQDDSVTSYAPQRHGASKEEYAQRALRWADCFPEKYFETHAVDEDERHLDNEFAVLERRERIIWLTMETALVFYLKLPHYLSKKRQNRR